MYHYSYIASRFGLDKNVPIETVQAQSVELQTLGADQHRNIETEQSVPVAPLVSKSSASDDNDEKFKQETFEWFRDGYNSRKQLIFTKVQ